MKRITRSLLSLCLALVLCAALLPAGLAARADDKTSYLVTGYNAGAYSIETNQTVNIAVSLSRIGGNGTVSRVVRGVDSFRGGDADNISNVENGTASFILYNLSYSGTGNSLSFTVYYQENGVETTNQTFNLTVSECVPYTEPEKPDPVVIPEPHAVFSSDAAFGSIAAGESKVISIYIQNVGSTTMRSPMVTVTPSDGLMITDSQSAYTLNDIRPNQSGVVMVSVKAVDKIREREPVALGKARFLLRQWHECDRVRQCVRQRQRTRQGHRGQKGRGDHCEPHAHRHSLEVQLRRFVRCGGLKREPELLVHEHQQDHQDRKRHGHRHRRSGPDAQRLDEHVLL